VKPPTIQFGKYRIRYRQLPYLSRFFLVDIKNDSGKWNKCFVQIQPFHMISDIPMREAFGFIQHEFIGGYNFTCEVYERLVSFMNKVTQYDKYLDAME